MITRVLARCILFSEIKFTSYLKGCLEHISASNLEVRLACDRTETCSERSGKHHNAMSCTEMTK